jgi:hypothetical protein
MSLVLPVLGLAWAGAAAPTRLGSVAPDFLALAASVAFVVWLARFAGRLHDERRRAREGNVVPFPLGGQGEAPDERP